MTRAPLTLLTLALACGGGEDDATSGASDPTAPTTLPATSATSGEPATSAADTTGTDGPTTGAPADTGDPDTTATPPMSDPATSDPATSDPATSDPATSDPDTTDPTVDPTGDGDPDPDAPPVTEGPWWRPGVAATWQLQLTGDIVTDVDADLYDIDLFDAPQATIDALQADGRKVICYFSAGSSEDWRPDFDAFDPAALGTPLDGWPGEKWLDVRHPSVWAVMRGRLDLAVQKRCDGVDPDNMDGYTQDSGFDLTPTDQRAYNRWIANQAHLRGLTVGLKNAGDQVPELVDYFDFELNEQCHEYSECDQLAPFTQSGKPVFNVEYPGDEADAQAAAQDLCPMALAEDLRTLLLPYELDGSWRVSCD